MQWRGDKGSLEMMSWYKQVLMGSFDWLIESVFFSGLGYIKRIRDQLYYLMPLLHLDLSLVSSF